MLFTEAAWKAWLEVELKNYVIEGGKRSYKKKGYLHFDLRFWLPTRATELKAILSDAKEFREHRLYPFVRWVVKTPRYKRNTKEKKNKKGEVRSHVLSIKERPIAYASHIDALIYSFYSFHLTETYQRYIAAAGYDDCVLAYRTNLRKNNIDFAREVFKFISEHGPCTAIALDIKGFFDSLDHELLKRNWQAVIGQSRLPDDQYKLHRSLTKYSYVTRGVAFRAMGINLKSRVAKRTVKRICEDDELQVLRDRNVIITNPHAYGIPQGSPISALLSNIYMIDFDRLVHGEASGGGFLYRRYCDDIILVCPTTEVDRVKTIVYQLIEKSKLVIQPSKEDEVVFRYNEKQELRGYNAKLERETSETRYKNLQYLGFDFDGTRIYLRPASIARFYHRMMSKVWSTAKAAYGLRSRGAAYTTSSRFMGRRTSPPMPSKLLPKSMTRSTARERECHRRRYGNRW